MVVPFFSPHVENKNVKRGRVKGDRQKLRNSKHKEKHIIGCYPKCLLILTAYQLQGWCKIILSPVKDRPDCSNVRENLFIVHRPKTFQAIHIYFTKLKNPTDGFFLISSLSQQSS